MSTTSPPTRLARLSADQAAARHIVDVLLDSIDPDAAAVSASEDAQGTAQAWLVEIHFRDPPDEDAIRDLIGRIAGPDAARAVSFDLPPL